jgi:hypothetical protein
MHSIGRYNDHRPAVAFTELPQTKLRQIEHNGMRRRPSRFQPVHRFHADGRKRTEGVQRRCAHP